MVSSYGELWNMVFRLRPWSTSNYRVDKTIILWFRFHWHYFTSVGTKKYKCTSTSGICTLGNRKSLWYSLGHACCCCYNFPVLQHECRKLGEPWPHSVGVLYYCCLKYFPTLRFDIEFATSQLFEVERWCKKEKFPKLIFLKIVCNQKWKF